MVITQTTEHVECRPGDRTAHSRDAGRGKDFSLSRALAAFQEVASPAWTAGIAVVRQRIRQGDRLGVALQRANLPIPDLLIGIVSAGESAGDLAGSLARAAELSESRAQLAGAIRNALAYPALLGAVGTISLVVIVGILLPKFATVIEDLGAQAPVLTRFLLAASDVARAAILPMLVTATVAVIWLRSWMAERAKRARLHAWLLRVPLLRDLRLASASSRLCNALAALLDSGVSIGFALQLSSRAAGDDAIAARLLAARDRVVGGARLSAAFADEHCVTTMARRLIRAGEESGRMIPMLRKAAELDARGVATHVKTLVSLLEPTLIVIFAAIVAFVAIALVQAVYAVRPL